METLTEKKKVEIKKAMGYKKLPLDDQGNLLENNYSLKGPRNLVVVSFPKSGKSLSMADIPQILVGDAEGGTDEFQMRNRANLVSYEGDKEFIKISTGYIPAGIFQTVDELNKVNKMKEYWTIKHQLDSARTSGEQKAHYEALIAHIKSMKFPIFCIDTITAIQKLNSAAALYEYNLGVKPENRKADIKRADEYSGVRYTRAAFRILKDFIEENAAPFIIWNGHVGNRKKIFKKTEEDISAVDIALDGLQSNIFTSEAQAVCIFYRNEKGCFLDFTKKEESDMGSRTLNLSNRIIKIADIATDEDLRAFKRPKTHWDEVYPEVFG